MQDLPVEKEFAMTMKGCWTAMDDVKTTMDEKTVSAEIFSVSSHSPWASV